jgi:hypothetical protein
MDSLARSLFFIELLITHVLWGFERKPGGICDRWIKRSPIALAHHSSARRLASSRVLASNVLSMHQLSDCSKIKPLPPYYVPKSGYANDDGTNGNAPPLPAACSAEETDACFIVRDGNEQALAYVTSRTSRDGVRRPNCSPATTRPGTSPPTSPRLPEMRGASDTPANPNLLQSMVLAMSSQITTGVPGQHPLRIHRGGRS